MTELTPEETNLPIEAVTGLRALTPARVGLGRTGTSQHTRDILAFQAAHAQARDAVHARLDGHSLITSIADALSAIHPVPVLLVQSAAADRASYLQRPDLGRRLDEASGTALQRVAPPHADLALVIADGLSALAVERHARPLLDRLLPLLAHLRFAPVCVVEQGRVALGDQIGEIFAARLSLVLIGERPGLSSPDSLGAYLTWEPRTGRTDAERNCISNIRVEGLGYAEAARQIAACIAAAVQHQLTGVALGRAFGLLAAAPRAEEPR